MRVFPIRINLANEATVQGSHDADARKQRWPARRRDQDQGFHGRLPLLGLVLGLRKLRDVPAGILERDELVPARQRDWISEATFPREWPNSASTQFFTLSREPDSNSTPGHWVIYGSSNGFKGDPMGRKKRSASWHDQVEALKAEAEKLA